MTTPTEPVDLSHLSDGDFNALVPQGYHGVGDCQPEPEGPTDEELELLITYQHAVSNQIESIIQSTGTYAGMDDLAAATLAGLHAVLARFGRPAIEQTRHQPEGTKLEPRGCPTPGACSCPTVPTVPPDLIQALEIAEAGLADIGDSDREPGDDLVWAESRAASCLPRIRAVLARWGRHPQVNTTSPHQNDKSSI